MLTRREKEVMELVISGHTIVEISQILFISKATVITHKENIQQKLHAKNSCHAVFLFLQSRLGHENPEILGLT